MKLNLILESKKIDENKVLSSISKNPCNYCLLGCGMACVERKYCRWDSHGEIFIKKEIHEFEETTLTTSNENISTQSL